MPTIRNRELSQFGSFLYITDDTRNIGIATESTPYVGIGTTNPQRKLHINGDVKIDGRLYYDGQLEFGNINLATSGIITASAFYNSSGIALTSFDSWTAFGSDIYRLLGNVGIATTNPKEKLDVVGNVITSGQFISSVTGTFTTGTAPLNVASRRLVTNLNADYLRGGEPGGSAAGDIVTISASQTLTNKTINLSNNTLSGTVAQFNTALSDDNFVSLTGTETLTNKTLTSPTISTISNSGTITLPTLTTTLVGRNTTDTLTNKTIAAGSNTITGLTNTNLSGSAGITNANLANSTISGVSLGSTLNSLSLGSYLTGGSYNGSSPITVSVAGTSLNTGNTLVARDLSGDFSAGTVTVLNLTASQTVQAQNFNSTSDERFKENISTFENAVNTLHNLRGVNFTWKDSQKSSIGVIAQELENILPELVNDGDIKSVNYNGLIGILIEAVKELSTEIEDLKQQLNK